MLWKLLVLFLPLCCGEFELFLDDAASRQSLSSCIISAVKTQLKKASNVLVMNVPVTETVTPRAVPMRLDKFLYFDLFNLYLFSLFSNKADGAKFQYTDAFLRKADSYVIHIRNKDEIDSTLDYLQLQNSWNPSAKFVIITTTKFANETWVITHLVRIAWRHKVVNAVFLMPQKNKTTFNIYTWHPFKEGKCGRQFGAARVIDECSFGNFRNGTSWFPNRIPNNLKSCEVQIRTIVWPPFVSTPTRKVPGTKNEFIFESGIEIKLMNTVAKAANFTPVYTLSERVQDWGVITINGTATGMMATVLNEEVDIGMCTLGATDARHQFFESSVSYMQEDITFCVPHSAPKPYRKRALAILGIEILLLCFIYIILIAIVSVKLARYQPNESNIYKNYVTCVLNVVSIITYSPVATLPRSSHVRFLIMLWVIFSLNLNIIYQTNLMSVLTSTSFDQELTTVEEMLRTNYDIYIIPAAKRFFDDNSELTRTIEARLKNCEDMEDCLNWVAYKKDTSMFTPRLYFHYVLSNYLDSNGRPLIYCFRENMVTYSIEMVMRKGFVLKDRINELLTRIVHAGLIPLWMKQEFRRKILGSHTGLNKDVAMSMKHLQFVFYIYILLVLFATAVFIVELLFFKFCKNRKVKI